MTNLPTVIDRVILLATSKDLQQVQQVLEYAHNLFDQGLGEWAFPAGDVMHKDDFADLMISADDTQGFLVYDTKQERVCAHFHLNGFQGLCANAHFSMLRGPDHIEIARDTIKKLFLMERKGNLPYVEALIGITPVYNKAACRFIRHMGFKKQFVAPSGSYISSKDIYSDALITMVKREDVV